MNRFTRTSRWLLFILALPCFATYFPVGQIPPTIDVRQKRIEIPSNKIDLNHAKADDIKGSIKGIGPKKALAIIQYRQEHHGFKSLTELGKVKGIGKKFVEKNKEQLFEVFDLKPYLPESSQ